ncbi:bifunctional 2-polyprenyl-6-hydroxyphenol methylase/3-demethylubiquinol 3-O-methyltransferase UbiG [Chelativorans sp. J32]|uniref:class I SAM-dependent methyltransferase n=1 Tax=Chelativorans sp. J32 TaxID=935840 RepID=UPI0018DDF969|nr:methyltransferase domain-containing protein [Chelativorans sp. J32]
MPSGETASFQCTAAMFDHLAERWDCEHGPASARAAAFEAHIDYLKTHCARVDQPRVLDIGCATGQHLVRLHPWIGEGIGIDLSPRMIERAAANARACGLETLQFVEMSAEELTPKYFGTFDLVLFIGVLEHMPSPAAVLRGARRILRSEGRIVIIMPHWLNPTHWMNRRADRVPARHLSLRALCAIAAEEGLRLDQAAALPHGSDLLRPFGTYGKRLFAGRLAGAGAFLRGAFGASLKHERR